MAQSPTLPDSVGLHYTLQEAAALLQIPVADLERAIAANQLLCVHQYGRKLIAADHLNAYRVQRLIVSPSVPDGSTEHKTEQ